MQKQQRKLWIIIVRIPPEHRGRQSNNQDPEVPDKLNSQILAPGLFPPSPSSQHKLYFLCTSAKWQYHCVVVWNIQCVKCSICVGMQGRKLSLGQAEGVRRLKNKWLED